MRLIPCLILILAANVAAAQQKDSCKPGDDGKREIQIVADRSYEEQDLTKCAAAEFEAKPTYPAALRAHNKSGSIVVKFVVDAKGKADMTTFSVVRVSDSVLVDPVKRAIAKSQFHPAEIRGTKVRSWVMQPFNFSEGTAREKLPVRIRP